jgi:hypothetical protein
MTGVMIVLGVVNLLFGAGLIAWALRSSEPTPVAFRYHGAMVMALGGVFILGNVFPPDGRLYAVLGVLGVVVFWSGWKHVSILRHEAIQGREKPRTGVSE